MKEKTKNKLLAEFLKNSRRSDRELARALKTSQPTITRIRQRIEREGLIKEYTIMPNWRKIGFEIMVLTFVKMRAEVTSEELFQKLRTYAEKFSNVFFASRGQGLGMTGVIMSLHTDFRDYTKQLATFRLEWSEYLEHIENFVMVTDEGVIKDCSFSYLARQLSE